MSAILKDQINLIFYTWSVFQYFGNQLDRTKLLWLVETITEHLQLYYNSNLEFIGEIESILIDILEAEFNIYLENGCPEIAQMLVMAKANKLNENLLKKQSEERPCKSLQYLIEDTIEECEVDSCHDCDSSFEHVDDQMNQLTIEDGWTIVKPKKSK